MHFARYTRPPTRRKVYHKIELKWDWWWQSLVETTLCGIQYNWDMTSTHNPPKGHTLCKTCAKVQRSRRRKERNK